jgi:hypothetical protein
MPTAAINDNDKWLILEGEITENTFCDTPPPVDVIERQVLTTLNVRKQPRVVNGNIVGTLKKGEIVPVEDHFYDDLDGKTSTQWRRLDGNHRFDGNYCAEVYTGTRYLDVVQETPPPTQPGHPAALTGNISVVEKNRGGQKFFSFKVGDKPWADWAWLCVNIRSAQVARDPIDQFWYSQGGFYVSISDAHWQMMLDTLNNDGNAGWGSIGVAGVRIFASHKSFSHVELVSRLRTVLRELDERNMKALLCLNDSASWWHTLPSEEKWKDLSDARHLNYQYWLDEGYRFDGYDEAEMSRFINLVVPQLKDEPGLFGWQLWNEPHPNGSLEIARAFKRAVKYCSELIWSHDQRHPIMIGLQHCGELRWPGVTTRQASEFLYGHDESVGFLDKIHGVSCHIYPDRDEPDHQAWWIGEADANIDLYEIAPKYGRVPMIDEGYIWNIPGNPSMPTVEQMKAALDRHYSRGLHSWWLWGFEESQETEGGGHRLSDMIGFNNTLNPATYYGMKEMLTHYAREYLSSLQ